MKKNKQPNRCGKMNGYGSRPGLEKILLKYPDLNDASLLYDAMKWKHGDEFIDTDILEKMSIEKRNSLMKEYLEHQEKNI